jgi:hypothetical protein
MFKVSVASLVKQLWSRGSLWRNLTGTPQVAQACGLERTLDRRLAEIAGAAARQSAALGLALSIAGVTGGSVAASEGSAIQAQGPVWHKKAKAAGRIPAGLTGLATDADWIQSTYPGWVYGDKAPVTIRVAPTLVRPVLSATVTGRDGESHVRQAHWDDRPPLVETRFLDAGYDDAARLADCHQRAIEVRVPLAKPIGLSTSPERRDRAAYWPSPAGKCRYQPRGCSSEPFFSTIKALFHLDPLPVRGKAKASAFILLALYAWTLIVLFHFVNKRPLGEVIPVLDLL